MIVQDMRERSKNSQTGVRACFNTKHKAQFSKIFSNIAVLVCFLSTIQPKLGTMEELKYGTKNPVLSEYWYYVRSGTSTFRRGRFWTPFWPVGHRFL